ncbi:MAG: hypothetical protein LBI14_00360 [Treponema sp.]|jgi:hypothetical protein|nr:hypothetical protein [Treponema sp.]
MKAEEIRSALEETSPETLADALAIVFAEGKAPSQAVAGMNMPELANFAQAVIYLKKNFDFEELEYFDTEADLVYVNAGDRRVLLTAGGNNSRQEKAAFEAKTSGHDDAGSGSNGGRFSHLEI